MWSAEQILYFICEIKTQSKKIFYHNILNIIAIKTQFNNINWDTLIFDTGAETQRTKTIITEN